MPRPNVTLNTFADAYGDRKRERIIEFNSGKDNGPGGLMSLHRQDDGTLAVGLYRLDAGTHVFVEDRHNVVRALKLSDGVELHAHMRYGGDGRYAFVSDEINGDPLVTVTADGLTWTRPEWASSVDLDELHNIRTFLCGMLGISTADLVTACPECGDTRSHKPMPDGSFCKLA